MKPAAPAEASEPARAAGARPVAAAVLLLGLGFGVAGAPALALLSRVQSRWSTGGDEASCSFRARTGRPCLGCGGTRALRLASRGDFAGAARANPLGAWAMAAAGLLVLAAGSTLVTGRGRALRLAAWVVCASAPAAFIGTLVWWWQGLPPGSIRP